MKVAPLVARLGKSITQGWEQLFRWFKLAVLVVALYLGSRGLSLLHTFDE